jgi:hypothetical protein
MHEMQRRRLRREATFSYSNDEVDTNPIELELLS